MQFVFPEQLIYSDNIHEYDENNLKSGAVWIMLITNNYFQVALERHTVISSAKVAMFVGTILALINYGDRIFLTYDMSAPDWIKIIITYAVPYCVSTYGAVTYATKHSRVKENGTSI